MIATSGTNEDDYLFTHEDTRLSTQGKKLTLQMTNLLLKSTEYTFTLPKNAVVNDSDEGNEEYTLTFTTASKITIDKSLLSISSSKWYEIKSSDNGSFGATITITYPTGVSNNESLSGFFDTDLSVQEGDTTSPVTISGLPDGLVLRMKKQPNRVELSLRGNATAHQKKVDNTSLNLTLLADYFTVSDDYVSADIPLSFDIIFGTAHWPVRLWNEAFAYDDKLWVLGGVTADNDSNVWSSEDKGRNWKEISGDGSFLGNRFFFQAFTYDEKLWALGGAHIGGSIFNDIWYSANKGVNWSKVTVSGTHWSPRYGHQAFVYNDKLWVLGGNEDSSIWNSTNKGTNWSKINVNGAHWTMKYGIQAFAYDDKLWVLGGRKGSTVDSATNEIWYSVDEGTNWSQVTVNGQHWSARYGHQSFAYDNKLWVLGGYLDIDRYTNDIWTSADGGTNWKPVDVQSTQWDIRAYFTAFPYDDKLWVLGGETRNVSGDNDIWYSSDEGVNWTEIDVFYGVD